MAKYGFHVGKYTSPMDCMGKGEQKTKPLEDIITYEPQAQR